MALDDVKQSIVTNISNAYNKALDKGADEPLNKNLENLASTIESIQGGTTLGYRIRSVVSSDTKSQMLDIFSGDSLALQNKIVVPSESQIEITADADYYALDGVTVEAIPNTYVGSAVNKVDETTYVPTTEDIVINKDQFLAGDQTIKGDANLLAENIAKDVVLFGVTGTHEGGGVQGYDVQSVLNDDGTQTLKIATGYQPETLQGNPIEIATDEEMANALTQANVGKVYKFTGTSSTYETDAIYIVSEV